MTLYSKEELRIIASLVETVAARFDSEGPYIAMVIIADDLPIGKIEHNGDGLDQFQSEIR